MSVPQISIGIDEGLLTIKEVAELPEIQKARLKYSRIRQWVFVGINGKKLPTILIGGIRYTTAERVLKFAAQCGIREEINSQEIKLPDTIPNSALTQHNRLAARLYPEKQTSSKEEKAK